MSQQDSTDTPARTFEQVLADARAGFWAQIASSFPMVKTGDFPPDAHVAFEEATATAAEVWLRGNLPAGAVIQTWDGYKLVVQPNGTLTDGDLTYDSVSDLTPDFTVLP